VNRRRRSRPHWLDSLLSDLKRTLRYLPVGMYYTSPTFNHEVARALAELLRKRAEPPESAGFPTSPGSPDGPPPGHPETVSRERPATRVELELWADALDRTTRKARWSGRSSAARGRRLEGLFGDRSRSCRFAYQTLSACPFDVAVTQLYGNLFRRFLRFYCDSEENCFYDCQEYEGANNA
jgi:hypothetical protein